MAEMELIEQMRDKRAFENALPPTSDEASFALRRRLMEEQEHRQWNQRETTIKQMQNDRLNLLQSALVDREKRIEEHHAERTESIRHKKTEDKERALAKIQRKRIKVLRKMYKARKNVEMKSHHRDIIEEYAHYGSTVYAPITRDGLSLDKKANKYEVQPEALSSYAGLKDLEQVLMKKKKNDFETDINVQKVRKAYTKELTKKDRDHMAALDVAQMAIERVKKEEAKEKGEDKQEKGDAMDGLKVRAKTPEYQHRDKNDAKIDRNKRTEAMMEQEDVRLRAVILLQRLMRGRAQQNMMFEGKEKRLDLITELRTTEEWRRNSSDPEEKMLIENYQERVMDGVTEALQASIISKTMDQLSKELVRLKQERRIAAMVRLAEDERRKREAEESGKRQAE
jgi:hypothetical protein